MEIRLCPHVCDIWIPGLPTILTGHIILSVSITPLIGICPLCKVGYKVVFDNNKCNMIFDDKVI